MDGRWKEKKPHRKTARQQGASFAPMVWVVLAAAVIGGVITKVLAWLNLTP